jgi:hypothetical protein
VLWGKWEPLGCKTPYGQQQFQVHKEGKLWIGGVAHAVERRLCKHEALSSNPGPTKKKKRKEGKHK